MTGFEPTAAGAGAILTIDLDAVAANYRRLRDAARPAACAAVVKADAYGLGAARVAPVLYHEGCRRFFVALLDEAAALRRVLPPDAEIFVLNGLLAGDEEQFIANRAIPVLNDLGQVGLWAAKGRAEGPLPAAIHLDTGMNRLGLSPGEAERLTGDTERLSGIDVRLWLSHLVSAEEAENALNEAQRGAFAGMLARLPEAPASFANSSGIFLGPGYRFDEVRAGVALYGVNPTPGRPNPMAHVVTLEGRVIQVRDVDTPMTVGYGATHRVARKGKLATISVGYADGYSRALSNRGRCVIAGRSLPIVGRVSMDLITVDVSDLSPDRPVRPGDLAQLVGPEHTVDDLAAEAGTIGYEILTSLGHRYARRYIGGAA